MTIDTWCLTLEAGFEKAQALESALETSPMMDADFPPTLSYFEQPGLPDWKIELFVTGDPDKDEIDRLLADCEMADIHYQLSKLEDRDWVSESQKLLQPVEAGRFFIYGSHDADKVPADKVGLQVDAGQAFGTGQHETTWACLHALDGLSSHTSPTRILDLGTGSGVLALAAERLWPSAQILASDIDPIAIDVTEENIGVNGSSLRACGKSGSGIACLTAEGLDNPAFQAEGPFDLITANILAGPLVDLAGGIKDILAPGGTLILSGLLRVQEEEVLDAYIRQEPSIALIGEEYRVHKGEWSALILFKPL